MATADAHELILRIRPLLQRYTEGDGFKVLLLCENIYGAVLRGHSQFREALALDLSISANSRPFSGKITSAR